MTVQFDTWWIQWFSEKFLLNLAGYRINWISRTPSSLNHSNLFRLKFMLFMNITFSKTYELNTGHVLVTVHHGLGVLRNEAWKICAKFWSDSFGLGSGPTRLWTSKASKWTQMKNSKKNFLPKKLSRALKLNVSHEDMTLKWQFYIFLRRVRL